MTLKQFDASKLGEPNSDLYWRTVISGSGPKLMLMVSKFAQAADLANLSDSVQLAGPKELIAANLRSLAKLMSDSHVPLKVISFFSGEYPNATMLYQAKQEPEDVIELSYLPDLENLISQLEEELKQAGVSISAARRAKAPTMALIIDDFSALLSELETRGFKRNSLLELMPRFKELGIGLYVGVSKDTAQPMFVHYSVLKEFDGYVSKE
jgi:hypothetical protein